MVLLLGFVNGYSVLYLWCASLCRFN